MAKGIYVGAGNIARRAKKFYVGVDGIARKVKKIYVGVNGVARLAWSGAFLSKYTGAVSPLTEPKWGAYSASNGVYAIFAGGFSNYYYGDTVYYNYLLSVDAYNASLVKTVAPALYTGQGNGNGLSGGRVGQYAYFGIGENPTGYTLRFAHAYNQSLLRTVFQDAEYIMATQQVIQQNDLNNPTFAICGYGFMPSSPFQVPNQHYGINSSLVKTYFYDTAILRTYTGTACIGGQVIVAGGDSQPNAWYANPDVDLTDVVTAYNSSYVKTSMSLLTSKRCFAKGICNNNYALFAGGRGGGNNPITTIDVYNASLVKMTPIDYGFGEQGQLNIAQSPEFALMGSGAAYVNDTIYGFDNSLVRVVAGTMSVTRQRGATVGDYIVFGAIKGTWQNDTVEVFKTT